MDGITLGRDVGEEGTGAAVTGIDVVGLGVMSDTGDVDSSIGDNGTTGIRAFRIHRGHVRSRCLWDLGWAFRVHRRHVRSMCLWGLSWDFHVHRGHVRSMCLCGVLVGLSVYTGDT